MLCSMFTMTSAAAIYKKYKTSDGNTITVTDQIAVYYDGTGKQLLVSSVNYRMGGAAGSLYLMNRNESKVKNIASCVYKVTVKGGYIYYYQEKWSNSKMAFVYRKCRCDLNGNNKKVLKVSNKSL